MHSLLAVLGSMLFYTTMTEVSQSLWTVLLLLLLQVRSIPDGSISISRLASDYLSTTGVCTSIGPPPTAVLAAANAPATAVNAPATAVATASSRQAAVSRHGRATATAAPCLFSYKDHWYLLATDRRGW